MAILKGQNLRVLTFRGNDADYRCIAKATSCTITLSTSTDSASTKDDVGLGEKPVIDALSWSASVDSLNVSDMPTLLMAIKEGTPFVLCWDQTRDTDNQTAMEADFSRYGKAILTDATFTFNDREKAAKSIQFSGTGGIMPASGITTLINTDSGFTQGERVRLFLSSGESEAATEVIAAAKSLQVHISVAIESATTKDTVGKWVVQEVTGINYDITTEALVDSGETITSTVNGKNLGSLIEIYESSAPVAFAIANVSGANNRTKGGVIMSGLCIISQITINAAVKQVATYNASLTGYNIYNVGV